LEGYDYALTQGKIATNPFAVEQEFRLPFEDAIVVVGKIDKIDRDGDDYIITDYKSGAKEPDEWFLRHDLQLTCYAWACIEMFGKLPKKLVWHHLRNGKLLETERTERDVEELKTMLHNALEMNRKDIRYRVYHSAVCNLCDLKGATCDDRELEAQLVAQRNALRANSTNEQSGTVLPNS
jgi:RecB family exonuclease